MISEEEHKELKAKNKALRKFLLQETEKTKALQIELDSVKLGARQKDDQIETLQMTSQRQVKRIEALQNKQEDQGETKKSSWGIWGASITKEDLEKVTNQLKITEEELEAKINENQIVHMKIFDLKNELSQKQDSLDKMQHENEKKVLLFQQEIDKQHQQIVELQRQVQYQTETCVALQNEKKLIVDQCERESDHLRTQLGRAEQKLVDVEGRWKLRVPFDPFKQAVVKNGCKATGLLKIKQQESLDGVKKHLETEFGAKIIELIRSLRNMYDGQLPVGDQLPTVVKKTGVYLEKMLEILQKMQDAAPTLLSQICELLSNGQVDIAAPLSSMSRLFSQFCDYLVRKSNYLQDTTNVDNKAANEAMHKSIMRVKKLFTFKQPGLNYRDLAQVIQEIVGFRNEMQVIATQFKRKTRQIPNAYETKSNNLVYLREDVLQSLHALITQLGITDGLSSECLNYFSKDGELNIQTSISKQITQAQLCQDQIKIKGEQGLTYKLQVELQQTNLANKSKIQTFNQICNDLKREINETRAAKDSTTTELGQEQALRAQLQLQQARQNQVIEEFKMQCTCSKAVLAPLEVVVSDEKNGIKHQVISQVRQNVAQFVTNSHAQQDSENPSMYQDVYTGLQKWALSLSENQQQKPVNDLVNNSDSYRLRLIQEKSLEKMLQMSQKMASMSRLSKGSSLQVMQKDKEWQIKFDTMSNDLQSQLTLTQKKLKTLEDEKQVVKRNYESQMRMLSEHIVDLNSQVEQYQKR